ncbi:hypothetical protein GCM10012275_23030 [Longimycelium tulufanense]|uniref:Uncharacterized protein n=1 Tax=Longimycelium tulufanense TaxID=907463 RepID=A0A8J3FUL9_9PSEU|nr:hypothetical protein GCM10012275_23030 [Longimycelium tulufanense]
MEDSLLGKVLVIAGVRGRSGSCATVRRVLRARLILLRTEMSGDQFRGVRERFDEHPRTVRNPTAVVRRRSRVVSDGVTGSDRRTRSVGTGGKPAHQPVASFRGTDDGRG